ncbi:glycosyltransferase [Lysobacter sp. D1-1-M9]|uniref:glycosyltransferase n=1 Tax=Novilysobacter longmucuonensis TaxID=3098603 RepID=UPI002FCAB872
MVDVDAARLEQALAKLTVVMPVGPGDALAPALHAQLAALPRGAELRVVFAEGAEPARIDVASPRSGPDWRCLLAEPGRGSQQNAGARSGAREWLWFLHADSVLAPDTLPALARFIQRGEHALGYFDLRFLQDGPALMRLNTLGAWLRSRWLGMPFGDQGLVLSRAAFERLGGFDPALAGGEDHDLVWRARRAGLRLRPLQAPLYTSARKYRERGWWTTTTEHLSETWRQARQFSRTQAPR